MLDQQPMKIFEARLPKPCWVLIFADTVAPFEITFLFNFDPIFYIFLIELACGANMVQIKATSRAFFHFYILMIVSSTSFQRTCCFFRHTGPIL